MKERKGTTNISPLETIRDAFDTGFEIDRRKEEISKPRLLMLIAHAFGFTLVTARYCEKVVRVQTETRGSRGQSVFWTSREHCC